jgi:hypothetical protein
LLDGARTTLRDGFDVPLPKVNVLGLSSLLGDAANVATLNLDLVLKQELINLRLLSFFEVTVLIKARVNRLAMRGLIRDVRVVLFVHNILYFCNVTLFVLFLLLTFYFLLVRVFDNVIRHFLWWIW